MSIDPTAALERLLIDAEAAHAVYERTELDGVYDEGWPRWYAGYLVDHGIDRVLEHPIPQEELIALLDAEPAASTGAPTDATDTWSARTARRIADRRRMSAPNEEA